MIKKDNEWIEDYITTPKELGMKKNQIQDLKK